ncbi:MAG: succinic semialdehyde dehydrogenase [Actinomycetota bacterium]
MTDSGAVAGRTSHEFTVDPLVVARLVRRITVGLNPSIAAVTAPFTGSSITSIPQSTPDDVEVAVQAARSAQRAWSRLAPTVRARPFLAFHDAILHARDELLDFIQIESGKARAHALEEVLDVAIVARHYARRANSYLRPRSRQGAIPLLSQSIERRVPHGVVGIISPWNYPLSLAVSDLIPALIAGNAVVLKPDSQTVLTALRAVEILTWAGVPEHLVQVVVGEGSVVGAAIVDTADYVTFTGSTTTGRVVARRAGERLIGASLELGGKNAIYVADDADLDRAAEGAVRGCFAAAGQLCVAAERLVMHEEIADAFLDRFLARVGRLRLGATLDFTADMGSLTNANQLDTTVQHVEGAIAQGARVLAGGKPRPDIGPLFYEPTVLDGVTPEMTCYAQETFGPVVAVYRVPSDDAAIALANNTSYGLNASVWTRDIARGRRLARQLLTGTVNINESYAAAWGSIGAPMGGMKDSGLGRRHGAPGIHAYTETQNVTAQLVAGFGPPPGVDQQRWADLLTTTIRWLKRCGVR